MKVLVIEDDREIVEVISLVFEIRWPEARVVSTHLGKKGVELVETEGPDVVILDLGLPDISGFDVLGEIRAFSDVPVLILTVRGEETDVVRGLERGADENMVKPFRQLELVSRVQALIRRAGGSFKEKPLVWGKLHFVPGTRQLFSDGNEISVTRTEATILERLMRKNGEVATHSELAEAIWGSEYPDAVDSLRVHIRRLRQKIEADPDNPRVIATRSGVGYMLIRGIAER
jgi:two-component system KDP operon response regulator KdpE